MENKIKLKNKSDYEFIDISSEIYRIYIFDSQKTFKIDKPVWLAISKTGHRILNEEGLCYYIPFGWIALQWQSYDDSYHFVK